MKQRVLCFLLALMLVLSGCGGQQKEEAVPTSQEMAAASDAPTWQEQFDLGVRFLSEGNYQEAIIAFQAAITIDPKRPETYAKLADVYVAQKDTDAALAILLQGYEATGDASLQEYRTTLELQKNPWPALTAEQKTLFHALAEATKNFDRAAVSEIMASEEYYYFYEEFPYIKHSAPLKNGGNSGGFSMVTDDGEEYSFSYWRDEDNEELDFWFYVYGDGQYYRASFWTPYLYGEDHIFFGAGHYMIGCWSGGSNNDENGPFKQMKWNEGESDYRVTEGTALNGIRVGTETRTEYRSNGESACSVVEFDQEGNLIYDSVQLKTDDRTGRVYVEYILSDGSIDSENPDFYPMDATTSAW